MDPGSQDSVVDVSLSCMASADTAGAGELDWTFMWQTLAVAALSQACLPSGWGWGGGRGVLCITDEV